MGESPSVEAGSLEFPIVLKLPQKEQDKLDNVKKQAPMLDRVYKGFSKGAGAMMATGAVLSGVAFLFSGQGFRQTFGVLWDILGLLSDMLFVVLWPDVIQPLLESMAEAARLIGMGPEHWGEAAKVLLAGIWDSATGLINLMVRVFSSDEMQAVYRDIGHWIWEGFKSAISIGGLANDPNSPVSPRSMNNAGIRRSDLRPDDTPWYGEWLYWDGIDWGW